MKVTKSTIARTIILLIALFNQVMTMTGKPLLPIDDETVNEAVSVIFTIVTAIVAWWKNNSFTQAALEADEVMREKKIEANTKRYEEDN